MAKYALLNLVIGTSLLYPILAGPAPKLSLIPDNAGKERGVIGDLFRPGVCQSVLGKKIKLQDNEICSGLACTFDVDCPDTQKCCPNECGGTSCSQPFIEDPCTRVTCSGQGQSCRVNDLGIGVCECNNMCPQVYQPVCGSDGRRYSNRCVMDGKACEKEKTITEGPCPVPPTEASKVTDLPSAETPRVTPERRIGGEVVDTKATVAPLVQNSDDTSSREATRSIEDATTLATTTFVDYATDETMTTDENMTTDETMTSASQTEEVFDRLVLTVPEYQIVEVYEEQEVRLFCDATSPVTPAYMWIFSRDGQSPQRMVSGQRKGGLAVSDDGHFLIIDAVEESHLLGVYTCMVGTAIGFATAKYQLQLKVPTTLEVTTTTIKPTVGPAGSKDGDKHGDKADMGPVNEQVCSLPLDQGNCFRKDVLAYWYYDLTTQQCRPFTYTGCGGNDNRFVSYGDCISACPELQEDPCLHPIHTGRCRAHMVRWAYDATTRECAQFVYGGCGANGNNFITQAQCDTTCTDKFKREDCLCVEPSFVDSFCSSQFVLTGRVKQKLLVPGFGALLAVEVEEILVRGNLTTTITTYLDGPLAVIRDVAQDACQCHDAKPDGKLYIFMGYINDEGFAVVDDTSFVKTSSVKRLEKLQNLRSRADRRCQ